MQQLPAALESVIGREWTRGKSSRVLLERALSPTLVSYNSSSTPNDLPSGSSKTATLALATPASCLHWWTTAARCRRTQAHPLKYVHLRETQTGINDKFELDVRNVYKRAIGWERQSRSVQAWRCRKRGRDNDTDADMKCMYAPTMSICLFLSLVRPHLLSGRLSLFREQASCRCKF